MISSIWCWVQWGTVGEWASSLAVLVALAALWHERTVYREAEQRRRYEEERKVASCVFAWPGRRMQDNAGDWYQEVRLSNGSDQTVRSLTAYVEFPQLPGKQFEAQFPGPLRPTPYDSVIVYFPNALADRLGILTDDLDEMSDAAATKLGKDAVVSIRFEDHEGWLWRRHQNGDPERLDASE